MFLIGLLNYHVKELIMTENINATNILTEVQSSCPKKATAYANTRHTCNWPPFFLEHCVKWLPPSSNIRKEDITPVTSGMYFVRTAEQVQGHEVYLQGVSDPNIPYCDCMDWKRHMSAVQAHACCHISCK